MEKFIRYKRFEETHNIISIEIFFNTLIENGWEIIYYSELKLADDRFHITVICGKKQNNII